MFDDQDLAAAHEAGVRAYDEGRPASPWADQTVQDLIKAKKPTVGGGILPLFRAFTRGRDAAADRAAAIAVAPGGAGLCERCAQWEDDPDRYPRCPQCGQPWSQIVADVS